jgi:hypothetical protein
MRRLFIRLASAALAFLLGVAANAVWTSSLQRSKNEIKTTKLTEEWHRLFEAAGMTGDAETIAAVNGRLLCANSTGIPDAWPVEIEARKWCSKTDGSIHELGMNHTSEYGSFHKAITTSHRVWALQNLDFVSTMSTARSARQYLFDHEWPSER